MSKGIIKASRLFWESEDSKKAILKLKQHVSILHEKLDSTVFLEPPQGIYILYCESEHFDEVKYGPLHEYDVTFYQHEEDGELTIEIKP